MKNIQSIFCILLIPFIFYNCKPETVYTPKPRVFPKVDYPAKSYQAFDQNYCAFTFEVPSYTEIQKDEQFFEEQPANACWFDIVTPQLNGSLHCSYYPISNKKDFEELVNDAFELTGKHRIKADYRDDKMIQNQYGVSGILFELSGPVASPAQFFLTDSTSHFLRASLYFNNSVAPDSMAPIHEFVMQDVYKMIETFKWTE